MRNCYWELVCKCRDQDPSNRLSFEDIVEILWNDVFAIEEFGMKTDLDELHKIKFIMNQVIIQKLDLFYEINRTDLTAFIIDSPNERGDIFIPSLLKHELQEFKIIGVKTGSFKNNEKIKSITIQDKY